ncbi:MAG: TonB-dependent receptor [Kordiimonadales bacterium]|nr:MAG: TonB-dependent receptor [Kordiimonadales bacterium]
MDITKTALVALLASTCISSMAFTTTAYAQDADEGAVQLEEIMVTARRRTESLQDVPVAVTAFSSEKLKLIGAADLTYLTQSLPNTTLKVTRGTNTTLSAFIRGVGQQDPVAGFEAGVGIYVDDVYLNRPQGAVLDVYDVERIEVLRGPQGTLYGRNTIGGAIKYVTKRLAEEPGLDVVASLGTYGQHEIKVTGETPVTDTFRLGGSVAYLQRNGFGENLTTGAEHYDKDVLAFRGSAELMPTPELFIRISGDYLKDNSSAKSGHRLIPGLASGAPVLDNVFDTRAGIQGLNESEQYGGTFLVEYEASDTVTIKNIFAYREGKDFQTIDFDSLAVADVDVPVRALNDQLSEEFQILYQGDGIDGVFGFYYLDATAFNEFDVILEPLGDLIGLPGLNATTLGNVETKTWSIFGDFTFDISEKLGLDSKLELSIGGRYTDDRRTSRVLRQTLIGGNSANFGGTGIPIATTSDFLGEATFKDFTPRASLSWQPNDDHTIYLSYSEGFKGGGFDPRGATTSAPDLDNDGTVTEDEIFDFLQFEPEKVVTYELGFKSSWAEGRVTTNIAFFYSDYTNVQVPGSVGVDTDGDGINDTFAGVTTNAGKARFYGLEFEGQAIMGEDISVDGDSFVASLSIGLIDASYDEFITSVTDPDTGLASLQDVADQRVIQNTPSTTGNARLTYSRPSTWFGTDGNLSFTTALSYKSETHQFEVPSIFLDQPAYFLLDASIVWTSEGGKYQVGLHGKNLTDKKYIVAGYNFANADGTAATLGLEGIASAFYGAPATATLTFGVKF